MTDANADEAAPLWRDDPEVARLHEIWRRALIDHEMASNAADLWAVRAREAAERMEAAHMQKMAYLEAAYGYMPERKRRVSP